MSLKHIPGSSFSITPAGKRVNTRPSRLQICISLCGCHTMQRYRHFKFLLCKAARARGKVGHVCADVCHALLSDLLIAEGFSSATSLLIIQLATTGSPGSWSAFISAACLQCFGSWLGGTVFSSNLGFCSMAAKNLLSLGVREALDVPCRQLGSAN